MRLTFIVLMFFSICLNLAIWLVQIFQVLPFALPPQLDPANIAAQFTLDGFLRNFTYALLGAGSITLVALLLRQNTYALYAPMIFAVGALLPIVSGFVLAIPNTISAIVSLYPELLPAGYNYQIGGVVLDPYSVVITVIEAVLGYLFVMGVITQREYQ